MISYKCIQPVSVLWYCESWLTAMAYCETGDEPLLTQLVTFALTPLTSVL